MTISNYARTFRLPAIALLFAQGLLVLLIATEPPTWSGMGYALGLATLTIAMLMPAGHQQVRRRVALGGATLLLVPLVVRLVAVKPLGELRLVDSIVDERDVSINAARVMAWTAFMSDPDVTRLAHEMSVAYDELAQAEGSLLPSPFVATYLGLELPGASDTLEFAAAGGDAVVFLHGFGGNFTMSCWLFARAARRAHVTTVCPSTRWAGDWWTQEGEAIARQTINALRARGKRVFLAGLSNGAIGASRIAPKIAAEIAGLVLLSGAANDAPSPNLPTLVIHGRTDAQIPASAVQAYAVRVGAQYVELTGGHLAMLMERDQVAHAIAEWFEKRAP
jgi:hypothetical protein